MLIESWEQGLLLRSSFRKFDKALAVEKLTKREPIIKLDLYGQLL